MFRVVAITQGYRAMTGWGIDSDCMFSMPVFRPWWMDGVKLMHGPLFLNPTSADDYGKCMATAAETRRSDGSIV
jgi:hypothetical protein